MKVTWNHHVYTLRTPADVVAFCAMVNASKAA